MLNHSVKTNFKRMKGVQESMLPSHLDKFMWREHHGRTATVALQNLYRDIALRYPLGECLGLWVSGSDPADANVGGMDGPTQIHVYTDRLADAGECSELIRAYMSTPTAS